MAQSTEGTGTWSLTLRSSPSNGRGSPRSRWNVNEEQSKSAVLPLGQPQNYLLSHVSGAFYK